MASGGDFLTRATIWLALAAYAGTALSQWRTRRLWTLGGVFYLAHIFSAFGFFHHWSHAAAYRETARQTVALAGWEWGGGLFVNYAFTLAWLVDIVWWWFLPGSRSPWLITSWHAFVFFMVFNGAVIFGHGPVRWFGALVCVVVVVAWWRGRNFSGDTQRLRE